MAYKFFVFTGKCRIFVDDKFVGISPREGVSLIFDVEEEALSASDRIYDIDSIITRRTLEVEARFQHITDEFFATLLGGAYKSNATPLIPTHETGVVGDDGKIILTQTPKEGTINVFYLKTGAPLERVDANPQVGEYTYESGTKTLTFNDSDKGKEVLITYSVEDVLNQGNVFYISENFTPTPHELKIWANVIRKASTSQATKITLIIPNAKIISGPTIELGGTPPTYSVRFRAHPVADGTRVAEVHYSWK